jgi:hypothetical protein
MPQTVKELDRDSALVAKAKMFSRIAGEVGRRL